MQSTRELSVKLMTLCDSPRDDLSWEFSCVLINKRAPQDRRAAVSETWEAALITESCETCTAPDRQWPCRAPI